MFERILLKRLVTWILAPNCFHINHYGFLPFHDCTSALSKLYAALSSARRQKLITVLVSFELASAYDSVWPDGLALKMLAADVDDQLVKWIHFSMWREFQVRWKRVLSDPLQMDVGVPQEAVLSPVLFFFICAISSKPSGLT